MKLTSMKMAKQKKSDEPKPGAVLSSEPEYPWGLRIRLESEQIKKLGGLKGCEVGEEVGIQAAGKVISISKEETKGSDRHTIEIQLTAIDVSLDADFEKGFDEAEKE